MDNFASQGFLAKEGHQNLNKTDRLKWIKNEKNNNPYLLQHEKLLKEALEKKEQQEREESIIFNILTPKAHHRYINIKSANKDDDTYCQLIRNLIQEKYETNDDQINDIQLKNILLNLTRKKDQETKNKNAFIMNRYNDDDDDDDYMNDI